MKTKLTDWPMWDVSFCYEDDWGCEYVLCIDIHIDHRIFVHWAADGMLN